MKELICSEAYSLLSLKDSRHVVNVYCIIEDNHHVVISTEYCRKGDLIDFFTSTSIITEDIIIQLFAQMVNAICDVHTLGICHRDIKLENFLLDDQGIVKLCDFGQSGFLVENGFVKSSDSDIMQDMLVLKRKTGTLLYSSPAIVLGKPYRYLEDIWSLGICLFVMVTKKFPFYHDNDGEIEKQIVKGPIPKVKASNLIKSILTWTMQRNRNKRIRLKGLKDLIKGEFDTEICVSNVNSAI